MDVENLSDVVQTMHFAGFSAMNDKGYKDMASKKGMTYYECFVQYSVFLKII